MRRSLAHFSKMGVVEKYLTIKGFGFVTGDDGVRYYISRHSLDNNPMVLFQGERVKFDSIFSDKTPEVVSVTLPNGKPFERRMQYGVLFRNPDGGTLMCGADVYTVDHDDIEQKDICRGEGSVGYSVAVPVSFYVEKGKPQCIVRAPVPQRKRSPTGTPTRVSPTTTASGFQPLDQLFNDKRKKGPKESDTDADIADLLDSFDGTK